MIVYNIARDIMTKIQEVNNPNELSILKSQTANFSDLFFKFSDEYISSLKLLVGKSFQYIVFEDDMFAGYIAVINSTKWRQNMEIIELFVSSKYQAKGIGTLLVRKILEKAFLLGNIGVIVQTEYPNIPAINFYKKIGFIEIVNPEWEGKTFQLLFNDKFSKSHV
jgi:GNAT superfamily N-acetyltransferase